MALDYGEIRDWEAADAGRLADAMIDRVAALESFEEEVREAGQWQSWVNSLGEAMASRHFMDFRDSVTDAAAEAQAARNTAEQVESALTFLESEVTSLEIYASGNQFRIGETGVVIDLRAGMALTPEEKLIREGIKRQIEQTVTEVVRSGREIESLAADGLRAISAGKVDDGGADSVSDAVESQNGVPPPPEQNAPAEQVRAWWESLTEAQQQHMVEHEPDAIRNLWGLPSEVRDELNREALDRDITDAQSDVDDLRDELQDYMDRPGGSDAYYAGMISMQSRLDSAKHHLETLQRTRTAATGPDRMLLEYDLSEDLPEVAISVGDPDSADNVSLTVEGYTTNVHDSVIGKVNDAQNLNLAATELAPGQSHATIAFLAYQHPQKADLLGVGTNSLATQEASKVENAARGIAVANHKTDVNLSLFGHSYGSTTSGIAAQELAADGRSPVDTLALYGSPGFPEIHPDTSTTYPTPIAPTEDLIRPLPDKDALGIDDGRAFHMTENGDFVTEIFGEVGTTKVGLGNPPRQWGLEELSMETTDVVVQTHPETGEPVAHDTRYGRDDYNRIHREDVGAHSIYTKNETISQHNLAAIAADRLDLLAR